MYRIKANLLSKTIPIHYSIEGLTVKRLSQLGITFLGLSARSTLN